jgi:hypothetical protein
MSKAVQRPAQRRAAISVALLVLLVIIAVVVNARWQTHLASIQAARSDEASAAKLEATYSRYLTQLHSVGNAQGATFRALVAALSDKDEGTIGQLAVAKRHADEMLADTDFDKAMADVERGIPSSDTTFSQDESAVKSSEQTLHDGLEAFSTTIGVVLNNPFAMVALQAGTAEALGRKIGKAEGELGSSWTQIENNVSALHDEARSRETSAARLLRERQDRGFFASLLDP